VTIRETLGEDGNVVAKVQNLTTNVVGKMGGMLGKGIGGISSKFGGPGSWF
jgi:calcium-dependent secretion activator